MKTEAKNYFLRQFFIAFFCAMHIPQERIISTFIHKVKTQ